MKPFSYKIIEINGKISQIVLGEKGNNKNYSRLGKECTTQIEEYLSGKRKKFKVPLLIHGTDFQKKVWKEMAKIPYGKTVSYKKLACRMGNPLAYRAVANACGANKIPIIIPCHRVVSSNGFGGYSAGIEIKKELIKIESREA